MSEPLPESPRWSVGGIAWLVGFPVAAAFTVCFLLKPVWLVSLIGDVHPLFLAIPWAFLVVLWAVWYQDRRRAIALAAFCKQRGWQYLADVPPGQWEDCGDMPLFHTGEQQYGHNGMRGKVGEQDLFLLDYHFSLSQGLTGRTTTTVVYYQTVVVFYRGGIGLPKFQLLARESRWTKPGITTKKDQARDLEVGKEFPKFAAHYKVCGEYDGRTGRIFTAEVCNYLADYRGWDVESDGTHVAVYQERVRQSPRKLEQFVENARTLLRVLSQSHEK